MSIILNIGKKSGIGSVSNLVPKSLDSFASSKGLKVILDHHTAYALDQMMS